MAVARKSTPQIQSLFFLPPQAIGRLGGSLVPLENYVWKEDPSIAGAARTVIEPTVTLDVVADGSAHPFLPNHLRFKDNGLYRPVAPFLELWAVVQRDGKTSEEPVTSELLERARASMAKLSFMVTAANLKAARRCGDPHCGFQAQIHVKGDDHQRHRLNAFSATGGSGGTPLVLRDRTIPLGFFQVLRPRRATELGINLDIIRVRYTPAAGEVYGPPSTTTGADTGRKHLIVKPENRILNPKAAWLQYNANSDRFQNPEPADTYDGADVPGSRSLGVVDDTCEVVIGVEFKAGPVTHQAMARVFVGPPDFAPDRRPFVSLADDLTDRELPNPPAVEQLAEQEDRINDLFLRALETARLFNLDAVRARAIGDNGRTQPMKDLPRTDAGSMTGEDRPFANLTADKFADRKVLKRASTTAGSFASDRHH